MPQTEVLTPWEPISGIDFAFVGAEVWHDYPRVYIRLIDGRAGVKEQTDLCLLFEQAYAFTVYEEFVHPSQGTVFGRSPTISAENSYTFPLLTVSGSSWLAEISEELELRSSGHVHYRLCTGFPVIDVASARAPSVYWLRRPSPAEDATPPAWARDTAGAF